MLLTNGYYFGNKNRYETRTALLPLLFILSNFILTTIQNIKPALAFSIDKINDNNYISKFCQSQQFKEVYMQSSLSQLPKLVLLDRDGVINVDVGSPGVISPTQLQLTPDAGIAIGRLNRAGCKVVLVTNQSCVGKKLITSLELEEIHNEHFRQLRLQDDDAIIEEIFVCTSTRDMGDNRMKPNPGMITEACATMGVSPEDCIMIGDTLTDMEAAAKGGVPLRILVETGYGLGIMGGRRAPEKDVVCVGGETELEKDGQNEATLFVMKDVTDLIMPFYYVANLSTAVSWILG